MKIVTISDTHGLHSHVTIPHGDMLIHAGDVSMKGSRAEVEDFIAWFASQPHKHKIFVGGNHDFYLEQNTAEEVKAFVPSNIIYLNDSGVTIEGVHIWGSPIQPEFDGWAFGRTLGAEIKKHWDLIPAYTDILITHGPPYGILDKIFGKQHIGCDELLNKVKQVRPKYHIFGHIHDGYGVEEHDGTVYINASNLNMDYIVTNQPIVLDYKSKQHSY